MKIEITDTEIIIRIPKEAVIATPPMPKFTVRQQLVLKHMRNGLCRKESAQLLGCSVSAIRAHRKVVLERLGLVNTAEVMAKFGSNV